MGIASTLFFSSNDTEKQTLHRRITPSDEQMNDQQTRWNELREHLITELRNASGKSIRTCLQGSYKYATQIRPPSKGEEFDIDLGVFFCWEGEAEDGEHDHEDLRRMTQNSLIAYAKTAEGVRSVDAPPKPRCMRIHYDGDFHIDVPCYHLDPDADARTLAAKGGWEVSDPKAIYLWFQGQFDDAMRAKVRRHICYLKCWAGLKWKIGAGRPSSVLLTVLVSDACTELGANGLAADDDALLEILRKISARIARATKVPNPVNTAEDLNRLSTAEWLGFRSGINSFIQVAEAACGANTTLDAVDQWSKAFRHFFPMIEASALAADSVIKSGSIVPVTLPDVTVTAIAKNNPNLKWTGRNRIGAIPKGCDIRFSLLNPGALPAGTTIEWVVRNEGSEAENVNDLGHSSGTAYEARDTSAYAGTHYMDCVTTA